MPKSACLAVCMSMCTENSDAFASDLYFKNDYYVMMRLKKGENIESNFVSMKFIVKCVYYSDLLKLIFYMYM